MAEIFLEERKIECRFKSSNDVQIVSVWNEHKQAEIKAVKTNDRHVSRGRCAEECSMFEIPSLRLQFNTVYMKGEMIPLENGNFLDKCCPWC